MSAVTAVPTEPAEPPDTAAPRRGEGLPWRWDAAVVVLAVGFAVWLTYGLWRDPAHRVIADNAGDQAFFEWLLGYGSYAVSHGTNPYFTDLLNAPLGVNLAVNTSITVYAVLLSPVTALLGPPASFLLALTLNLAGGAIAWYALLARYVVRRRAAAAVAGLFCGFAPGFISHANGHLNWSAGWVAPVLLWWVLKLREPRRWRRNGLILGVLVSAAFTIAAEGLFFTALACGVFLGVWAVSPGGRAEARAALPTVLAALAVTAAVAGALLAYPLWMHFAGPQSFAGTGFNQRVYAESVAAYGSYPARSLAGVAGLNSTLAPNPTEETSFFGLPLLALVFTGWGMLWRDASARRRATLRALAVTGAVFAVLSFGPRLKTLGIPTAVPLPYAVLERLPLFNAALPARFALVVVGVIGALLALTADRLLTQPGRGRGWRTAWAAGFAVALIPIVPAPLLWAWRAPIPTFVASGAWQRYVPDGGALTALPLASNALPDGQRWQAYTLAAGGPQFAMPGGYFLGPDLDGRGRIGALPRPTDRLFTLAAQYGLVLPVDRSDQELAQADFAYWGVRVVILPDYVTPAQWPVYYEAVRQTATALLGPPERVDDVWLWRITATGAVTGAR